MIKAYYQLNKFNFNKGIISKGKKRISRSFVKAFIDILYYRFYYGITKTVVDTSGVTKTLSANYSNDRRAIYFGSSTSTADQYDRICNYYYSSSGTYVGSFGGYGNTFGIVVGSGTATVTTIDDNLQTQIAHGTSSGQLQYLGSMIVDDITVSGSNASYSIERLFLNGSGGNVTINEIALYGIGPASEAYIFCLIHDLVSPAVVVANGEYLKVMYTITVSA